MKYNPNLSIFHRPIQTDIQEYVLSHTEVHSSKNSESPDTKKNFEVHIFTYGLKTIYLIRVLENLIPQENLEF